ncbi:MAG: hypothetical protein JSV09_00095, partial [Thermoplasmata archaeon]
MVRLVITGDHIADSFEDVGRIEHDSPYEFTLWVELLDDDESIDIDIPSTDEIKIGFSADGEKPTAQVQTSLSELPLPIGAMAYESVEDINSTEESEEDLLSVFTKEYLGILSDLRYGLMEYYSPNWRATPYDRIQVFETELGILSTAAFYMDEMSQRGWTLTGKYLILGEPEVFLFFSQNNVTMPIIIEKGEADETIFTAYLPPDEDILNMNLSGWTIYTTANSGLVNDWVSSIAFDEQGTAWIGTRYGGLSVFDGVTWTSYTVDNSGLLDDDIRAIVVDDEGDAWLATWGRGISVFDGAVWTNYTAENSDLGSNRISEIVVDEQGKVWVVTHEGISVYADGKWTSHSNDAIGSRYDYLSLAEDDQGQMWLGSLPRSPPAPSSSSWPVPLRP